MKQIPIHAVLLDLFTKNFLFQNKLWAVLAVNYTFSSVVRNENV